MTYEQFEDAVYKMLVRDYEVESHDAKVCVEDMFPHYLKALYANMNGESIVVLYAAKRVMARLKEANAIYGRIGAERKRLGR
jgi:hypothetical protein